MTDLFPLRVAQGDRFCNRIEERELLAEFIRQKRAVVLISPRRYGKTSLANKVVQELEIPFCELDFLTAFDAESICRSILHGVSKLISAIMPLEMKTIKLLEKCFHGIKAGLHFKHIDLEFTSSASKLDPVRQVLDVLQGLEALGKRLNYTVVVFIDEFQRVLEIEYGDAIQGAIRSVAQMTQHIAFMFSGSSRHMLSQAFDDENSPLYMMCEKVHLERIAQEHYFPYIQDAAKIKWGTELSNLVIERILELTERHPFYVNYLCSRLWRSEQPPIEKMAVDNAWRLCLKTEDRRFIELLDKLTLNQRLFLQAVAQTTHLKEPTSVRFLSKIHMSSGTATPILKNLRKKDLLYIDENGLTQLIDPLLKLMLLDV